MGVKPTRGEGGDQRRGFGTSRLGWSMTIGQRISRLGLLLVLLPVVAAAQTRQIVGPSGCGAQADEQHAAFQTHTVYLWSGGTAGDQPRQDVWITAFNPLAVPQLVTLVMVPDGGVEVAVGRTLAPRERWPVHANQVFKEVGLLGNINFALILAFQLHGAASMATWSNNYQTVFYNPPIQSCEVVLMQSPYGG